MNETSNAFAKASELSFSRTMNFEYGVAAEVAPGVRRIVANNPGPFTFKGTNTYIVGRGNVAVIDPGPDDDAHREAILRELDGERITHLLITHGHRDHTDGAEPLRELTQAPILAFGAAETDRDFLADTPEARVFVDDELKPDRPLRDGEMVKGEDWILEVIHTPGHAPDHLCFALVGKRTVFSGDHVMGWNTTVVAPPEGHMASYIASLERLLERNDKVFLPGHGERIETPQRAVKAYVMHRKWRESAILQCLSDGDTTIAQIVARIYAGLEQNLVGAAALSVLAHLQHLIERGLAESRGPVALESEFVATGDAASPPARALPE